MAIIGFVSEIKNYKIRVPLARLFDGTEFEWWSLICTFLTSGVDVECFGMRSVEEDLEIDFLDLKKFGVIDRNPSERWRLWKEMDFFWGFSFSGDFSLNEWLREIKALVVFVWDEDTDVGFDAGMLGMSFAVSSMFFRL